MTEEEAINNLESVMAIYGVAVKRIPQAKKQKRPDFEFSWHDEHYVVEMKQRDAEWHLGQEENTALDAGEIVERHESMGFYHGFAERITHGSQQIAAFNPKPESFRLVWYWTYGDFADIATKRIITTLIGDAWVVELGSKRQSSALFFEDNTFSRLGEALDGAVVGEIHESGATIHFILNPFSSRYGRLVSSQIAKVFSEGVRDPNAMERNGEALIVDSLADRTSERSVLNYLGAKYGINVPQRIPLGHMAAMIRPAKMVNDS
jgi:hypothetical protein